MHVATKVSGKLSPTYTPTLNGFGNNLVQNKLV